jgi:hypothetical protein
VEESVTGENNRYVGQFRQADATNRRYGIAQILSKNQALDLRGEEVTFSFYARTDGTEITTIRAGIVEWTGSSDSVTSDIVSAWAATPTLIANAAFANTPGDVTISSSWTQVDVTVTLGTSFNNLVLFIWTSAEEAQNDDLYIGNVELVAGTARAPWNRISKPFYEDLEECQRFFRTNYPIDTAPGAIVTDGNVVFRAWSYTNAETLYVPFGGRMRSAPTITTYATQSGTSGNFRNETDAADLATTVVNAGDTGFVVTVVNQTDGDRVAGYYTAEAEL